jgi:cytochrome c oxidase assembly protein subunit 15
LPPFTHAGWQTVYQTYYREIHGITQFDGNSINRSHGPLMSLGKFQVMFAIEYAHRFVAALVSIVFLVLAMQIFRQAVLRQWLGKRMIGMAGLLLTQAVLGGIVVKYDLKAELVAVHLGVAFLFFSLVFCTALRLLPSSSTAPVVTAPRWYFALSFLALATVYLQILSGGLVAGTHAGYIFNTWPLMGESLIPDQALLWVANFKPAVVNFFANQVLIQFVHRWWAFAAALVVFVLLFTGVKIEVSNRARWGLRALGSLIVLQILLGIMTLVTLVSPVLAAVHLMGGFAVFAVLVLITFELKVQREKAGK